ncbi:MAG: hypothetical protein GVY30_00065 [Chloroflexi bacterium]|nr:hypothetical protein [Chloroflexota bacterium]
MITVKELIAQLLEFDGETPVVVDGYEGGYDDALHTRNLRGLKRGGTLLSGRHRESNNGEDAILIS